MSKDHPTARDLRQVAERWMHEIWQERRLDNFDDLHAEDFIDHSPAGRASDRSSYRDGIEELFEAFPDFCTNVEDLVIDVKNGKVAVRWTATGTHSEPFLGFASSGGRIYFSGIEIIHVHGGRIIERWGEWDGLSLIEQLRGEGG